MSFDRKANYISQNCHYKLKLERCCTEYLLYDYTEHVHKNYLHLCYINKAFRNKVNIIMLHIISNLLLIVL